MALTDGRVAKPERRWDCRRGPPPRPLKTRVQCVFIVLQPVGNMEEKLQLENDE